MSMKTPLNQTRGLGSAKEGVSHFWHQRVTAVALIPLTGWFIWAMLGVVAADHASASAFIAQPLNAVMFLLFIGAGFLHLQLGLQVVIEDYVSDEAMKVACILLNNFFAIACGTACAFAVLKISLGA